MPTGNGGVIGKLNAPTKGSASGIWSLVEAYNAQANSTWPTMGDYILPPATRPSIGASFEGGFYTGLIWNQVTQSSTSTAIGTGAKTFTLTEDMSVTPLFYQGQEVEVRSRANPDTNRMIGTVSGASGTNLTVSVTSVDGSGTFTDWSIMAKYRVIVAPKSSGESTSITLRDSNTALPSETYTLTEGLLATLGMVNAGNSTTYPAAHFCNNLNINGYTDWFIPARDQLELIWRNLKPGADSNYTGNDRSTSSTRDYKNLGSIGDTATGHGTNKNSSPQGTTYTSSVPSQTSVSIFQSGGAEALAYGPSTRYWSCTESESAIAWAQIYGSDFTGSQGRYFVSGSNYLRAIRRSID